MVDIVEKSDLEEFEQKLVSFMEHIFKEPLQQWFSKEDLAKFRKCSVSQFDKSPELLPNFGVPEDRWGRTPVWSRETVKKWLGLTRDELLDLAGERSPEKIDKDEYLRQCASVRNGKLELVK